MVVERLPITRISSGYAGLDGVGRIDLGGARFRWPADKAAIRRLRARQARHRQPAPRRAIETKRNSRIRLRRSLRLHQPPPARSALPAADFAFVPLLSTTLLVPRKYPGSSRHYDDTRQTNQRMHGWPPGDLGQDEMAGKGQEDAEAENLQRMLAAQDQWPQPRRFQARPLLVKEAHGERRQCQEMREAKDIEVGLVDRIHPVLEPASA